MRAFLVDDEILVRGYLAELLIEQGVAVVGEAGDAPSALAGIAESRPDVVFVDVRMPGISGLHLAEEIRRLDDPPHIVLATGHSEHAVAGFDLGAADYLLKPVSPERLMRCLARLRPEQSTRASAPAPFGRLPLRSDAGIRLADPAEVACALSRERKVYVRLDSGEEFRFAGSLAELEARLEPLGFLRIHDSYLVPVAKIREVIPLGNHEFEVRLADGRRAPVGRTRYPVLRKLLGF